MPTHYHGTSQEELALDTFIKFIRAIDSLTARIQNRGTMASLTMSQFGVLETLYHLGPMCPGDISVKLLKSGGNITLVLDNLEKQGLVRREREVEDRRMVMIYLTEAGRDLISRLFPAHVAVIVAELSCLTAEEQQTLGRLCRKLGKSGCSEEV
jgi:MarR family 2-MHQ and catechol resistance regulon transcriptional repressor